MPPPDACISRKRCGHGFGEKSLKAAQHEVDVALERLGEQRMQRRRGCRREMSGRLDHRIVAGRAGDDAAVDVDVVGLQKSCRCLAPATRSSRGCSSETETRSGSGGRPRRLICARDQLATKTRRLARIRQRDRAGDLADQQGRLIELRREDDVLRLDVKRRLIAVERGRRRRRSALTMRNGNPLMVCVPQA